MAALVATIATFFSGVMGMVSTLTTTIVGDDLLVLGVVAVPLVGISVGLLSPASPVLTSVGSEAAWHS